MLTCCPDISGGETIFRPGALAIRPAETARLLDLIAEAARTSAGQGTGAGGALRIGCSAPGRDYRLDAELAARIERVTGEGTVDLSVQEPPKLALVG